MIMKKLYCAILGIIILSSCKTDVDINAPYEKIPVVYGILDRGDSIHYVKITKTFAGQGNAYDFAKVPDSSYFESVDAKIEQIENNSVVNTFILTDTILNNKDTSGVFYAPEQKLYYFVEPNLSADATYILKLNLDEGQVETQAETRLIDDVFITQPITNNPSMNFANSNSAEDDVYPSTNVAFTLDDYGTLYNLKLRFKYDEYYSETNFESKEIIWNQGEIEGNIKSLSGGEFYPYINERVPEDPNVLRRIFRGIDLILDVGSDDLKTYIEVSKPSSGVVQNLPDFTNIENGRGIFTSRFQAVRTDFMLNTNSIEELCEGKYTGSKKFKIDAQSPQPQGLQGESYYYP